MSIYRAIFRNSLKITWRNKYLWFFGIFAAFVSNIGEFNLAWEKIPQVNENATFLNVLKSSYEQGLIGGFWMNLREWFVSLNFIGWMLMVVLLLLVLFLVWLSIVSQAGIFASAYKIFKKKKTDFSETFRTGREKFWQVLWLNILFKLFVFILWIILILPLVILYLLQGALGIQSLFVVLSFVILLPITIILSFIIKYAILFVVTKKMTVNESLKEAWYIFKHNWLISVEMAIILFFLSVLFVIVAFLVIIIISSIFSILMGIFSTASFVGLSYVIFTIAVIALILLILWLGAMWSTFVHACWAILFTRISEGQIISKIARLLHPSQEE
ncbi:MAG: hypothetical protein ABIA91_02380 [Patescibacteria group bacterium]